MLEKQNSRLNSDGLISVAIATFCTTLNCYTFNKELLSIRQMNENQTPETNIGKLLLRRYQEYLQCHCCNIENSEDYIIIPEWLKQLLNCDRAIVWVLDDSRQVLWTKLCISNEIKEIIIPLNTGWPGRVIASRKTLNIPFDLYNHPDHKITREVDTKIGYRVCSLLGMPIFNADGKIIGAVLLTNKINPGHFPSYNPQNWPEAPKCWQNSFSDDDEAFLEKLNQQIATVLNRYLQQNEWRQHPKLIGRMHADYPDDLQVMIHDGGSRLTSHHPEVVWVNITKCDGNIFTGKVLNQPNQLTSVSKDSEILFIMPDSGQYPLLVTEKYLQERSEWLIQPCNKCGLSELFDPPSELIRVIFPNTPTNSVINMFTTFCGVCGGIQGVQHNSYNLNSETRPNP